MSEKTQVPQVSVQDIANAVQIIDICILKALKGSSYFSNLNLLIVKAYRSLWFVAHDF